MRILHLSASYKPAFIYGGPIISVAALCERLRGMGVDARVFTTTANGDTELDVPVNSEVLVDGVPVIYFKRVTGNPTHFSPALMRRLWKELPSYDVVHVHAWWNMVSVLGTLYAMLRRKPVVLSPRGTLSPYSFRFRNVQLKRVLHGLLGDRLLRRCWFHVTSYHEEKDIYRFGSSRRIATIPNLLKLPKMVLRQVPSATFRIVFFSRIDEKKGLDTLLHAVAKLDFRYEIYVAGMGEERYLEQMKELAISLNIPVNWMGKIIGDAKYDFLASADLMVLPSRNENFGNVVPESLAAGTPVLISDEVGLSEYIEASGFGWVCKPQADSVAERIREAYADVAKREWIRSTAPKAVVSDFDSDVFAEKYLNFYRTILHDRI